MIDVLWLFASLMGFVLVRLLLQRHMRLNATPQPCLWPENIQQHPDVLAWITGGPKRVMETWFAQLSLSGVLTQEKGVFAKSVLDHKINTTAWSVFMREAYELTPEQGSMLSLNKTWRALLEKFKTHLIEQGVLVLPDPSRLRLSQSMMWLMVLMITAGLSLVLSSMWWLGLWVGFVMLSFRWWTFAWMPSFISPVAKLHAVVVREKHQADVLTPVAQTMVLATALEGSRVLLNTPFDVHSFPQMHASRLDTSSSPGTGCTTSHGWTGCASQGGGSSDGEDGGGCGGGGD